ncbi:MAG: DUF1810 domain-containing protein [Clostridiales bacterium]|nr:DUF1810 domain-containing protein [Clostridiales bacterium]
MNYDLERFKKAQAFSYDSALREVRNGLKTSHWMWYIFPQVRGLGHSSMADFYGISGEEEARAYLADPVLGGRLNEICEALMELEDRDAGAIFGFPDVLKLRSSMTLFAEVSGPDSVFQQVLDAYYHGEKDERTLQILGRE